MRFPRPTFSGPRLSSSSAIASGIQARPRHSRCFVIRVGSRAHRTSSSAAVLSFIRQRAGQLSPSHNSRSSQANSPLGLSWPGTRACTATAVSRHSGREACHPPRASPMLLSWWANSGSGVQPQLSRISPESHLASTSASLSTYNTDTTHSCPLPYSRRAGAEPATLISGRIQIAASSPFGAIVGQRSSRLGREGL